MLTRFDPPLNASAPPDEPRLEGWLSTIRKPEYLGAALVLAGLTGLSTESHAQIAESVSIPSSGLITRDVPFRGRGNRPYWISYDDCIQDDEISFPVAVSSSAVRLEVWVGTSDCVALRSSRDREQCWIVAAEVPQVDPGYRINVNVRNVVARLTDSGDVVPEDLSEEVCRNSTAVNGEPLTYYFMLVNSGTPQASTTWGGGGTNGIDTGFDVVGPSPPQRISVGLGEGSLSIEIDDPGENADRALFRAYCVSQEDLPVVQSISDAGATQLDASTVTAPIVDAGSRDGGIDGGVLPIASELTASSSAGASDASVPQICNQPLLSPSELPPDGTRYQCGSAGKAARTLNTSSLVNERVYAVAVAGEDLLGNVGSLSNVECAAPVPLEDFYESYRRQGGLGGGGYCSLSPSGPTNGRSVFWGLFLSLLSAFLIRRRNFHS